MHNRKFTHLHVHTEYSLLDGSAKINGLIEKAKELGMDSIAITDHGVMYGVIDFYKHAKANKIKPILGCEVYVASGSRKNKENSHNNFYYHLVLLAENIRGYKNLMKLVSLGFTEGFYYKPRIDMDLLEEYKEGLICLSACLSGPVSKNILNVSYDRAKEVALKYNDLFGNGNFYLELQDHGMADQRETEVNQQLVRMHKETGIPIVCTNDVHYINKEDSAAHDILLCIQTGKTINDTNRMSYEGSEFYLKSPEEMYELFPYAGEGLENTHKIAMRCNVDFVFNEYKLPKFSLPDISEKNITIKRRNELAFEYLKTRCLEGLKERYEAVTDELSKRLTFELDVIKSMGFVDYFLIVWDFIKYAGDNGIIVGPGRGSAAGSLVSYCLRITDIDPIKYNLIFERFLNPERISMPDIDIDFCYERRQEVIDYVVNKYGSGHVAQIITFGTMAARNAIRDVGRALDIPYADVDKVAKMIPMELGITIKKALSANRDLADLYESDGEIKNLIDMSMKLEGLPRHASTHAAGVVICDVPVMDYVPLNSNDGVITTQFTMNTLEELGLLKMDFLGLRTLTVIQNAINEIKRNYGITVDFSKMEFDDKDVFGLIAQARTEGVFQLESPGMKQFFKELKPDNIEDIIAGISLYRPGPMDFIPKYLKGKNNKNDIVYTHPSLEPILKSTYGCIVYQEQVMQIFRELSGYGLGRSDLVRRAMSKKKTDVMALEREYFVNGIGDDIPGCVKNGIPKDIALKIFDEMSDFAKYAFNKSHAAAYAVIAYETAWLKYYYPVEFMAALLTSVMDSSSKVSEYINECRKMGIELLPPDVNEGFNNFSVSNGKIRFGLAAIKNVGRGNIKALVKERESGGAYTSLTQFLNRLEGDLNIRAIESLIKAGAYDALGGKRSQYMAVYRQIYNDISNTKKRNIEGQINLFEFSQGDGAAAQNDNLPVLDEYEMNSILSMEKEILGVYLSGHPLSKYEKALSKYVNCKSTDFLNGDRTADDDVIKDGAGVVIGGIIMSKTIKYTKNDKIMAFITIEDLYGAIEVIIFPNIYAACQNFISEDTVVLVEGRASVTEDSGTKIICDKIRSYDSLKTLWLKIKKDSNETVDSITRLLRNYKGYTPVIIYDEVKAKKYTSSENSRVNLNDAMLEQFKKVLGDDAVVVK